MAWVARTASQNTGENASSITVVAPVGMALNDVLVCWIMLSPNARLATDDTTWAFRINHNYAAGVIRLEAWTKVVGAAEPGSWTFTLDGVSDFAYIVNAYGGGDGTITGTQQVNGSPAGASVYTTASITPAVNGALVIGSLWLDSNDIHTPISPLGGAIADATADSGPTAYLQGFVEHIVQAAAGPITLSASLTTPSNVAVDTGIIALAPAGSGSAPVNTVAPLVSGNLWQGQTVGSDSGVWTNSPTGYTYQWQRDVAGNNVFSNIAGATASTRVLAAADVGNQLRCVVTATNAFGNTAANSNTVGRIGASYVASISTHFEFCGNTSVAYTPGGAPPPAAGQVAGLVPI